MKDSARAQLARFVVVGALGFAVDAGVLTALVAGGHANVYLARGVSFTAAVLVTWLANRHWTFGAARSGTRASLTREYARYFVVQVCGAVANLAVFVAVLAAYPALVPYPVIPLAIGAVVGLAVNFAGSRRLVFPLAKMP